MAILTVQVPAAAGSTLSLAAAAELGDEFVNTGAEIFVVNNASAGVVAVTFVAERACSLGALHNDVQNVAIGATEYFPGHSPLRFNDGDTQRIHVDYDDHTSVTVGVLKGA